MKKFITITALFMAIAVIATSCGGPKHEKTINNLKSAIQGETNANARYVAFSQEAAEQGLFNISKMFEASAAAEAIHVRNHNDILELLGVKPYHPEADEAVVLSTLENILAAIAGETFEFEVMYPEFITDAYEENCLEAVRSFEWAKGAEMTHAKFKTMVVKILQTTGNDATVPAIWYVCSSCGDLYYNIEGLLRCPLDNTDISLFLKFENQK
jgi:rubrerythrin